MIEKENIKIVDSKGFHYEVEYRYQPHFGLVFAYYRDRIIGNVEYGRIMQPMGDNDAEWECYEEMFCEFQDMAKTDLYPKCQHYFDTIDSY